MNKHVFIEELRNKLKRLPQEEVDNAIRYYIEYFEDAGMDDKQDVLEELDSPSYIASQILSDYAFKQDESNISNPKNGISSIWFIILSILAAPVALPLAFALVILLFTMVFVVGIIIFTFSIISLIFFVVGIGISIAGFTVIFKGFATAIIFIGTGLVLIGLGLLIGLLVMKVTPNVFRGIANLARNSLNRLKSNK